MRDPDTVSHDNLPIYGTFVTHTCSLPLAPSRARAGEIEHAQADGSQSHRGAQIRLLQDEEDREGDEHGRQRPVARALQAVGLKDPREDQDHPKLDQLRGLQVIEAQIDPATGVVPLYADEGDEDERHQFNLCTLACLPKTPSGEDLEFGTYFGSHYHMIEWFYSDTDPVRILALTGHIWT